MFAPNVVEEPTGFGDLGVRGNDLRAVRAQIPGTNLQGGDLVLETGVHHLELLDRELELVEPLPLAVKPVPLVVEPPAMPLHLLLLKPQPGHDLVQAFSQDVDPGTPPDEAAQPPSRTCGGQLGSFFSRVHGTSTAWRWSIQDCSSAPSRSSR